MRSKAIGLVSPLALAILLTACASAPLQKPDQAISKAQYAIEQAQQVVTDSAQSLPLYRAQQKLDRARALVRTEDPTREAYSEARRLAEQAAIDARLAEVQAEARQAQAQTEKLEQSLLTLQQELEREEETE